MLDFISINYRFRARKHGELQVRWLNGRIGRADRYSLAAESQELTAKGQGPACVLVFNVGRKTRRYERSVYSCSPWFTERGQAPFLLRLTYWKRSQSPLIWTIDIGRWTGSMLLVPLPTTHHPLLTALSVPHRSGDGVCDRVDNRSLNRNIASLTWGPQIEPYGGLVHTLWQL